MLKTCSVHAMVRNSMFAARYWPGHILGMMVVSKCSTECMCGNTYLLPKPKTCVGSRASGSSVPSALRNRSGLNACGSA